MLPHFLTAITITYCIVTLEEEFFSVYFWYTLNYMMDGGVQLGTYMHWDIYLDNLAIRGFSIRGVDKTFLDMVQDKILGIEMR